MSLVSIHFKLVNGENPGLGFCSNISQTYKSMDVGKKSENKKFLMLHFLHIIKSPPYLEQNIELRISGRGEIITSF